MKTLLLTLTLVLAQATAAQDNVTFVHGLNGDAGSWSKAAGYFEAMFEINSQRIEYSSTPTISAIASSEYPSLLDSTVVVAHSMGGLVAREMERTNPSDKIRAMVTVGTPHLGAKGAELPGNNHVQFMIGWWVSDLAGPWVALEVPMPYQIAALAVYGIVGHLAQILTNEVFGGWSVQDMRSTSPFLGTLNAAPATTFPAAYYTLWSTEYWNMHFRLIDAMSDGVEDGLVMAAAAGVEGFYLVSYFRAKRKAEDYYNEWLRTGSFHYLDEFIRWKTASKLFRGGAIAIAYRWQMDWNNVVVGLPGTSLESDGIVQVASQRPSIVPSMKWILIPGGINHFEQRTAQSALDAIESALRRPDIAVSVPLRVSISGPSTLPARRIGTWRAHPSGGIVPYTYDWDYQLICAVDGAWAADLPCNTWHDGGTGATFSQSINNSKVDLQLRITIKDSQDHTATAYRTVDIN